MDESNLFLNYDGLEEREARFIRNLLSPSNTNIHIEFPWNNLKSPVPIIPKGRVSSLNIHAPVFQAHVPEHKFVDSASYSTVFYNGSQNSSSENTYHYPLQGSKLPLIAAEPYEQGNAQLPQNTYNGHSSSEAQPVKLPVSTFKLNPTVSSFVPLNFQHETPVNGLKKPTEEEPKKVEVDGRKAEVEAKKAEVEAKKAEVEAKKVEVEAKKVEVEVKKAEVEVKKVEVDAKKADGAFPEKKAVDLPPEKPEPALPEVAPKPEEKVKSSVPPSSGMRSWADIVSSGQKSAEKTPIAKGGNENKKPMKMLSKDQESDINSSVEEDKMALALGKHLYYVKLNFETLLLQPRGLINRRNWCYINATLQALLACAPFYTLVRNLPLGPAVERGKSSTPVIDCMVKLTYEFTQFESAQEELQTGTPFQPDFIYEMLKDLKSDCLKGQQEDAEEFLSFILNGMHEEMVKIIKNYEKKNDLQLGEMKENGDLSDGEDEWTVIGSKHRGMVTRKVAEHKTPVSELLGGQIKSFLTISGSKTSASIQPFFTLQLDIQSENVNSVSDALREMTVKEPIQGYTCAKTKQEVEAYSHIALQKLPPILILHLKRFIYNKTGCKKVMKKTDYPLVLDLSKDMMSSDLRKNQKIRKYKLFAVMYHDGEEAVKGHYICDTYSHGCKSWVRCDDRAVTAVTEAEVLSHSPPRVPYLLFYQEC